MASPARKRADKHSQAPAVPSREETLTFNIDPALSKRLRWFSANYLEGPHGLEDAAQVLLMFAAMDLRRIAKTVDGFCRWREAEGFTQNDQYQLILNRLSQPV